MVYEYEEIARRLIALELKNEEKDLLIRALTFYYEKCVWKEMVETDSNKASDEDYNIRVLSDKLGIRERFPIKIKSRW